VDDRIPERTSHPIARPLRDDGRVPLLSVPLAQHLHRLPVVSLLHGRLATEAWSWNRRDTGSREWWPQGITWATDSLLLVSWYAKSVGSRISVVSLSSRRYEHVTLLDPSGAPLLVHAGGIAFVDDWLYVGATALGFWSLPLSSLDPSSLTWRAADLHAPAAPSGGKLRWSFLDHDGTSLIGGEYGRGKKSTRLYSLPVSAGSPAGPVTLLGDGPKGMQGACSTDAGLVASVSHGPWVRGSLHPVSGSGSSVPGALPIGVEDLTRSPDGDLWTVAEHPWRRAIVRLRAVRP
jgi:hypothetical protein